MSERKSFAVYVITRHGVEIAERIAASMPSVEIFASPRVQERFSIPVSPLSLPMGTTLDENFEAFDCHIFIISVGAVVRMIAPRLRNKKVDPAVVCVDDGAQFSICVLSGHVGRGNQFTQRVAQALDATPVVTTASDVRGTLTVDILGRDLGWELDDLDRNVTAGCAAVVNASPVAFVQECGQPDFWPLDKQLPEGVQYFRSLDPVDPAKFEILLIASDRSFAKEKPEHWNKAVVYRPKTLVLGLGCDKGTDVETVERGVLAALEREGLSPRSIHSVATIDLKAQEPALVEFCKRRGIELRCYTAQELDAVSEGVQNPSETVKRYVGTKTVAEGACLLAAQAKELLIPKQKYSDSPEGKNMTVAVARISYPSRNEEQVHG